jgi:Holliday junction resolvase
MAATPERAVKARVESMLKAKGVYYFFPATHGYGRSGVPDIIACMHGQFVGIECKAGKGTTTALQERELKRIREAGGVALVIHENNFDVLEDLLA